MRVYDATQIPADMVAASLRACADKIIREDGDRDHMNGSKLTCEQTVAMAKIMIAAADKLMPLSQTE